MKIFLSTLVLPLSLQGIITYEKTTCFIHVYTYEMNGIFHSYDQSIYMYMHCDGTYMFIYIYLFTYMFQIWFPM
jgi:hypothetical protein